MQKNDPLIHTKLYQPFTAQKLVSRPRLQNLITESLRANPLTLVIAPAGFGKTTLVAASLAECDAQVAWLSIERADNQVRRFLAYLIAALQNADEQIGREVAQLTTGIHQVMTEVLLTSLINEIDQLNQQIVLVLDDFQYISDQEILSAVAFLLDHCPRSFHLLIATRSDPLIQLSRLRARGQMLELRAVDLRFTENEALQFLNEVMGLQLDHDAVVILDERTEGWIAGLQMAALGMRDRKDVRGFIEGFSGTNRHILDFLLEEIMVGQSPEIQHFLLCTSILDRLNAPLCDALLASDEKSEHNDEERLVRGLSSTSALIHLERENLFLISLDDKRTWYRYHHLFTDLLRARLQQLQPGIVSRLHHLASAWFEKNGFITEAIHHLLVIREYEHAANLVERYGPAYLEQDDLSIFHMAEKIPAEWLITRPKIGLYQAWFFITQGNIRKAVPLLAELSRFLDDSKPNASPRWMKTIIYAAQAFIAPAASITDPYLPDDELLDEIPAVEPILRNAADFLYAMALGRRGMLDRAVEFAIKCIKREKSQQGKVTIPTLAPFLTRVLLMQGRLSESAALCHEYLDTIEASGYRFVYTSGSMKIDLGEIMYEKNYLEEAEQYIRDGLKDNEPWRNIMTDCHGLITLARVLLAKGDYTEAMQVAKKLNLVLETRARPREFEEDGSTLPVRIQLASGDLFNPSQWAEQIQPGEDFTLHKERYVLTLARVYLALGKCGNVVDLLKGATLGATGSCQLSRQLESDLLLSAAYCGLGLQSEALDLVKSCLSLAEPEGYIRVFLNVGKPIQNILAAYLRSGVLEHQHFAQQIMDAFLLSDRVGPSVSPLAGLVESLSERELEVLQFMAMGLTNEEIAQQLVVARGTIKAHAASIYRKLEVANRTEAVTRARQLGILP